MKKKKLFIHDEKYYQYKFSDDHPFNPVRLNMTVDLLDDMGLISDEQIKKPVLATDEMLLSVHTQDYINAVKAASIDLNYRSAEFGIGTDDTPVFADMHNTTALVVGGTVLAAEHVMSGEYQHAINLAGGLHHAFAHKASGFCIYSDVAVAIKEIQKKHDIKAIYIDTDAHHGDGVQSIFYNDPSVLTVSFHETGKYLFPGTGHITERGEGDGYGYAYNLPLEPFTEDESFIHIISEVLHELFKSFKPDIVFSQHGCDSHYLDPLTHLYATIDSYVKIPKLIRELANEYCQGRWVAVGGGGYDIWRVVPRAWSLVWAEMNEIDISQAKIPQSWIDKWSEGAPTTLPPTMQDPVNMYEAIPRKGEIEDKNILTMNKVLHRS